MAKRVSEEERQKWKEKILNQRESGVSIAVWCQQNNIAVQTFYYWRDKYFPKINRSNFTEIEEKPNLASKSGVFLEFQGIAIHVDSQFDSLTLKKCLKALKELSC